MGKGLGAFFGDDVVKAVSDHSSDVVRESLSYEEEADSANHMMEEVKEKQIKEQKNVSRETLVKLSEIEPNGEQPRKNLMKKLCRNYQILLRSMAYYSPFW